MFAAHFSRCRASRAPTGSRPWLPPAPRSSPMPLSSPNVPRARLHLRRVTYEGYRRDDGLYDIDAHITDTKDDDFALLPGVRPAGEPIHDMHVRVTMDRRFTIHAIEARTD